MHSIETEAKQAEALMEPQSGRSPNGQQSVIREVYDDVQSDGRYEEGMASMAVYHRYCQDR
jgi:hypothetical protein